MPLQFNRKLLWDARRFADMSRPQAAETIRKLGFQVSGNTIQYWEKGWSRVPAAALGYLAEVYGCDLEDFYVEKGARASRASEIAGKRAVGDSPRA